MHTKSLYCYYLNEVVLRTTNCKCMIWSFKRKISKFLYGSHRVSAYQNRVAYQLIKKSKAYQKNQNLFKIVAVNF